MTSAAEEDDVGKLFLERYTIEKVLGEGSYGKVKKALDGETQRMVALKVINKATIKKPEHVTRIKREVRIMRLLNHPNIVKLYDVAGLHLMLALPQETEKDIVLSMEYIEGGELFDYIVAHNKLNDKTARRIFRQIVSAVDYCHQSSVIHRDLKPENLLLDSKKNIKIIDFGFVNLFDPEDVLKTFCGSPFYASPEMILGRQYVGPEVDVWSMGVILFALLTGQLPFRDVNTKDLYKKITTSTFEVPPYVADDAGSLIRRMLHVDPAQRATLEEVRYHPWVNKGFDLPPDSLVPLRRPLAEPLDQMVLDTMRLYGFEPGVAKASILASPDKGPAFSLYWLLKEQEEALMANASGKPGKHGTTRSSLSVSGPGPAPNLTVTIEEEGNGDGVDRFKRRVDSMPSVKRPGSVRRRKSISGAVRTESLSLTPSRNGSQTNGPLTAGNSEAWDTDDAADHYDEVATRPSSISPASLSPRTSREAPQQVTRRRSIAAVPVTNHAARRPASARNASPVGNTHQIATPHSSTNTPASQSSTNSFHPDPSSPSYPETADVPEVPKINRRASMPTGPPTGHVSQHHSGHSVPDSDEYESGAAQGSISRRRASTSSKGRSSVVGPSAGSGKKGSTAGTEGGPSSRRREVSSPTSGRTSVSNSVMAVDHPALPATGAQAAQVDSSGSGSGGSGNGSAKGGNKRRRRMSLSAAISSAFGKLKLRASTGEGESGSQRTSVAGEASAAALGGVSGAGAAGPRVSTAIYAADTTSTKQAEAIMKELDRVFELNGIAATWQGYRVRCVSPHSEFEIEVLRIKGTNMHGLELRRKKGSTWSYQVICRTLINQWKL
ncbi:hypothetical protein HK101_001657 [Irineochytrium annulatum]|nr:hypothetical protein HK101_001657 [Irineochytrium annulatum]